MKSRPKTNHPDMGFQIAPMIDVVFVIMLYFMVMAGSAKVEHELKMKLPGDSEQSTASTETPDELTISVAEDGQVSLNDSPVDDPASQQLPNLTREVTLLAENAKRSKSKLLVTVSAEETAKYERIAYVLNAIAKAGASENVTFAVADAE
jgi:biopolymer transport protein ExbD